MARDIDDLRLLVLLAAAGSLSEAARRLGSSPPAMSRRLAAIERRLGVRLVNRSSRRFALTEEGGILHERAQRILAEIEEAEAEVSAQGGVPRGMLRVSAPMQIGRRVIAPLVSGFTDRYPGTSVQLVLTDASLDLVDEQLDVALRVDLPEDPNIVVRKLRASRRVVGAAPAYLARRGTPERPEDLLGHDCIRLVRGRHLYDRWSFAEHGRRRQIQVGGTLSTTSAEVLHGWVLAGKGIGLKALWDIEEDLREGRLSECLAAYSAEPIELYAAFASRSLLPPRIRVFVDFVAAALAEA